MKFGVIRFPGSCDEVDAQRACALFGDAEILWHRDDSLKGVDAVVVPGGFSYGDYLRVGAIARFSPVMGAVEEFARGGGPVLGICNGFQVLCEAGLLPGALLRNRDLKCRCEHVHVRVEQTETPFTCAARPGQVLHIPIGHGEGNYFAPPDVVQRIEANGQVLLRYVTADGEVEDAANPNGSVHAIAGLCNERRNVAGMMPHPERACERPLGSADGRVILDSIVKAVASGRWSMSAPTEVAAIK